MEVEWREQISENKSNRPIIYVSTFGNFDVLVNGESINFERSKSKELLAYLVDRKGSGATTAEIASVLWEDVERKKATNNAQQVISSLMRSLKEAEIKDIVIKKWNYLAINPTKVICDYYAFLKGESWAINAYMGEYMSQYSWAEMTTATLQNKMKINGK